MIIRCTVISHTMKRELTCCPQTKTGHQLGDASRLRGGKYKDKKVGVLYLMRCRKQFAPKCPTLSPWVSFVSAVPCSFTLWTRKLGSRGSVTHSATELMRNRSGALTRPYPYMWPPQGYAASTSRHWSLALENRIKNMSADHLAPDQVLLTIIQKLNCCPELRQQVRSSQGEGLPVGGTGPRVVKCSRETHEVGISHVWQLRNYLRQICCFTRPRLIGMWKGVKATLLSTGLALPSPKLARIPPPILDHHANTGSLLCFSLNTLVAAMRTLQLQVAQRRPPPPRLEKRAKATQEDGPLLSDPSGQAGIRAQVRLGGEGSGISHLAAASGTPDTVYLLSTYCHF